MNVQTCDACGREIIIADNAVHLDYPAVPYAEVEAPWTLMQLGSSVVASVGDPSPDGLGHRLHDHQPAEGVMS
jgi:hypothetical protein